jgi:transcriptional regulator with XRE-family HTH domain
LKARPSKKRSDLQAIGARIRELRGGMFQQELAEFLEVSQGQLSKIERGKLAPTPEILIRLVEKFGKTADWILMGCSR